MNKKVFKDKYVVGEGFPWGYGENKTMMIGLNYKKNGLNTKQLAFPKVLRDGETPKYRIILERVNE